jgi:hypothetical protein
MRKTYARPTGVKEPASSPSDTASPVAETLATRASTHGDFIENGRIMQILKADLRTGVNWDFLRPEQREALEMIVHKIGRILSGDPNEPDHWKDIAGYATLVYNILTTGKSHA